jgi:hypothetical protein
MDDWMTKLIARMDRTLTPAETDRAQALRAGGHPVALIAQALLADAAAASITTPEYIISTLRARAHLSNYDKSKDEELRAMSPMDKLRNVIAWEIGDERWADQFITWAKDCGIQITDPRA